MESQYAEVNGVRLHYMVAGEGPLVVLLHGFPEFWYTWRLLIPALVDAGFRVVAPDQRGYNLSAKPKGRDAYRVEELFKDISELITHLGADKAHVVAHDWGGGVGWYLAMQHPEQVDRLVILDSPHPQIFAKRIFRFPQALKSWYMFAFAIPWLPELLFRMFKFWLPTLILRSETARDDRYGDDVIEKYKEAWSKPQVWRSTIDWYRSLVLRGPSSLKYLVNPIDHETLVLWGMKDKALGHTMAQPSPKLVPNVTVDKLPDAAHFVHIDDPDYINERIAKFLSAG